MNNTHDDHKIRPLFPVETRGGLSAPTMRELPSFPPSDAAGSTVCAVVRLYMAVESDLPVETVRKIDAHVRTCSTCSLERQAFQRTSALVSSLDGSFPSERVDQAIFNAIAASRRQSSGMAAVRSVPLPISAASGRRRSRVIPALITVAAVLVLAALSSGYYFFSSMQQAAFALPSTLSWDNYVLYHKQTITSTDGGKYQVLCYHDMKTDAMNVETIMTGKMDVVVVKDDQESLGLDMMHHIAQWNVSSSMVDDSLFDLTQLRQNLQSGKDKYIGRSQFDGQSVYQIRTSNGDVLLLNMDYLPVNVLASSGTQQGTSTPVYDVVQWLKPGSVSASMWKMSVPANFQLGSLTAQPT